MHSIDPPYHRQQILRSLPGWTRQLQPAHAQRLLRRAHREHVQPDGQLADWFVLASPARQAELRQAIKQRTASSNALAKALQGLQGITEFCEPLLKARLGVQVSLTQAQFSRQPFTQGLEGGFPDPDASHDRPRPAIPSAQPSGAATLTSLLEAALHNFEGMAEVGPFSTLQLSVDDTTPVPGLSTSAFVGHCRALDLGKRYQQHLRSFYGGRRKNVLQPLWSQARRDELTAQALIAHMRGHLTDDGLQALLQLCASDQAPGYGAATASVRTLSMLGTQLHDLWLLAADGQSDPVYIAYLPFDDDRPVQEFINLLAFGRYLRRRLLEPDYRERFLEHVALKDRPELARKLKARLFEGPLAEVTPLETPSPAFAETEPATHPWQGREIASESDDQSAPRPVRFPALAVHETPIAFPVWPKLFNDHVQRLLDDARRVAVPTADIDTKAREERLMLWGERGLTLLGVAAMFVPGLDVAMLAVGAGQVMSSIFHGFEAWSEGDNAQAVSQVESLLVNLGSVVAIAGVARLAKASGFVDWMESLRLDDQERLWQPQLAPYRSPVELPVDLQPDDEGILQYDDRHFLELDDALHEVRKDAGGDWRILHPDDPQAYQPRLHGNGNGAWRVAHERPQAWPRVKLMRRLGPLCKGLTDEDLLAALDSSGLERGVLEQAHADGRRPAPLLEDALRRLNADSTADTIIARTRQGRPLAAYKQFAISVLGELPGWPEDVALEVFDGAEPMGSATRYGRNRLGDQVIQVTRSDLENGYLARIVLENLDEETVAALLPEGTPGAQRQQALQTLMADRLSARRASLFDSLYSNQPKAASPATLAIARQFPSLPWRALDELAGQANSAERDSLLAGRVPLRIAEEARLLQARVRLDRAILGLYRNSLANTDSQLISDNLVARHPQWSAQQRYHAALADRSAAARLIGQQPMPTGFRSPLRLSDGRYGYPLSPGMFASRAERELHALYPGLTGREIRQLLGTLRARGSATEQIQVMRTQLAVLREQLGAWASAGANDWGEEVGAFYTTTTDQLIRAWQRLDGEMLSLFNVALDALPPLSTRFDHITTLTLENLNVIEMPADFLQAFPSLRRVDVRSSPQLSATSLLRALRNAPQLRELRLSSARLGQLPVTAHEVLPTLNNLRSLELPRNRLTLTLADLQMIAGLRLENLDLRANRIALDADMAGAFRSMRELRHLHLTLNPLGLSPDLSGLENLATLRLDSGQLQQWPTGLSTLMQRTPCMLREVDLSMNRIGQVPDFDTLLNSAYFDHLLARRANYRWRFNYNPLDERTRESLRVIGASVEEEAVAEPLPASAQRTTWLNNASNAQQTTWNALFEGDRNACLRDVVEQVGMSASALRQPEVFARQVWTLLDRAAASSRLRRRLNEVAAAFPVSCGDAGADGFGTLQIEVMAYDETAGMEIATPPLFQFFRRLFRRDQVNALAQDLYNARLARRDALRVLDAWQARPLGERGARPALPDLHRFDTLSDDVLHNGLGEGLDLIEIRLALRTRLSRRLDFPEPQQEMLYRQTAEVSTWTEDAVHDEVEIQDASADLRRQWISRHPTWRRLLRREYSNRFDALRRRWDVGLDYLEGNELDDTLEPPVIEALTQALGRSPLGEDGQPLRQAITNEPYIAGMKRMALGLEEDEDGLYLRLTTRRDPND
ncbi:NEL-type E3 ubiquitin ligase domain-containing protein [Mitsuaria sp. RG]|nr:NEL-type E3 ubiquitin ligase domain-containing protein [Mitsuaria sp. RG]